MGAEGDKGKKPLNPGAPFRLTSRVYLWAGQACFATTKNPVILRIFIKGPAHFWEKALKLRRKNFCFLLLK